MELSINAMKASHFSADFRFESANTQSYMALIQPFIIANIYSPNSQKDFHEQLPHKASRLIGGLSQVFYILRINA